MQDSLSNKNHSPCFPLSTYNTFQYNNLKINKNITKHLLFALISPGESDSFSLGSVEKLRHEYILITLALAKVGMRRTFKTRRGKEEVGFRVYVPLKKLFRHCVLFHLSFHPPLVVVFGGSSSRMWPFSGVFSFQTLSLQDQKKKNWQQICVIQFFLGIQYGNLSARGARWVKWRKFFVKIEKKIEICLIMVMVLRFSQNKTQTLTHCATLTAPSGCITVCFRTTTRWSAIIQRAWPQPTCARKISWKGRISNKTSSWSRGGKLAVRVWDLEMSLIKIYCLLGWFNMAANDDRSMVVVNKSLGQVDGLWGGPPAPPLSTNWNAKRSAEGIGIVLYFFVGFLFATKSFANLWPWFLAEWFVTDE